MTNQYNKYYQTENLFGNPYPELIAFFAEFPERGNVLDLGCGQGRDAISLAHLGFDITGIDNSKVGIAQMNQIAKLENLPLKGIVKDIYKYKDFDTYDFVLLDSMFHFAKKDLKKETEFIQTILTKVKKGCMVVVCIQDTAKKVAILNETIETKKPVERILDKKFTYTFEDTESKHVSKTEYRMIVVKC